MDLKYLSTKDAYDRLHDTVVRYQTKPVLVRVDRSSEETKILSLRTLRGRWKTIDPNSEELDSSSPPLGFMNDDGNAIYLIRFPHRRWKAGVCPANTKFEVINKGGHNRNFFCPALADTIEGIYPTFNEALRIASVENSCAFSRHLAIDNAQRIWCGTTKIGAIRKGKMVVLKPMPSRMFSILGQMTGVEICGKHL